MKGFWLSSSLVLALLAAGVIALVPPEAGGNPPTDLDAVVEALESPAPEAESIPEASERQEASTCFRCIALATECTDPQQDLGKRCGLRGSGCRCGYCGFDFNCYPN